MQQSDCYIYIYIYILIQTCISFVLYTIRELAHTMIYAHPHRCHSAPNLYMYIYIYIWRQMVCSMFECSWSMCMCYAYLFNSCTCAISFQNINSMCAAKQYCDSGAPCHPSQALALRQQLCRKSYIFWCFWHPETLCSQPHQPLSTSVQFRIRKD